MINIFESFYNFALHTLSQLGGFANSVFNWLTTPRDFGGTYVTIVELIIGSGFSLILVFLLAKIVINIII